MRARPAPILLLLLLALPAVAQTKAPTKVEVTAADCRRLFVEHRAAPDVAYRPGVDVRGRPVASADLNPATQIKVPETVTMDVAVDMSRYGVPVSSPLYRPNIKLGEVRVDVASGRVLYNGEPLGNPEMEALRETCRREGLAPR